MGNECNCKGFFEDFTEMKVINDNEDRQKIQKLNTNRTIMEKPKEEEEDSREIQREEEKQTNRFYSENEEKEYYSRLQSHNINNNPPNNSNNNEDDNHNFNFNPVNQEDPETFDDFFGIQKPSKNVNKNTSTFGKSQSINGSNYDEEINIEDFRQRALIKHNQLRALHGAPPLRLDIDICNKSQHYAEQLANNNNLIQDTDNKFFESYGENIYSNMNGLNPEKMVSTWYNEIKEYNYDNPEEDPGNTGHFTQIVWKNTQTVGFGFAKNKQNYYYGVAHYYPAGNVMNEFQRNVSSPVIREGVKIE